MIREKVTIDEFSRIAKENEYFLWHFLQKEQEDTSLVMWSIFEKRNTSSKGNQENLMNLILNQIDIPYYESYTEDSIDFLMDMGLHGELLWAPRKFKQIGSDRKLNFNPVVIGFKRNKKIVSTLDKGYCYCHEGVIEVIGKLNPEFLLNSKLD